MIKISSHTYKPTSGVGPFTYQWSSPNTCVFFDKSTGTVGSGSSFVTDIFVSDLTCFQFGVDLITLALVDANGCQTNHTFYPTNPCNNLSITNIGQGPNEFDFSVTASGGDGNYNFDWSIKPDGLFAISTISAQGKDYQSIHITPLDYGPKPNFFDVTCVVTDYNGCKDSVTARFPLSGVLLSNIVSESSCIEEGNKTPSGFAPYDIKGNLLNKAVQAGPILLSAQSYAPGCEPDWTTISFALPDTSIQYKMSTNPTAVTFYGIKKTLFKNGFLNIPFTVLDCKGAISNEAYITIYEAICGDNITGCPLIVNNLCITNCDAVFTINLEDLIKSPDCCSENSIDWTTFDILPGAPKLPATVEYNAGNHTITYTANGSTEIADLIRWGIKDALGNYSGIKTIQIARLCPQAPACTDDCYYVSQNAINHPLNVLNNDLGPNLKLDTLVISQIPTHGTAYVLDGDIYYTPFNDYEGVDTLKYKIFNYDGLSCEATVTLNIAENGPAGTGNSIVTCALPETITNDVEINGVYSNGDFDIIFTAYKNDEEPLEDGDELDVTIVVDMVEIASATLIIGEDYTTLAGVKTGTDDQWLTGTNYFSQFLTAGILDKNTLVTGQTIKFNKKDWAWATGHINTYEDLEKGGTTQLNAESILVTMKARDVSLSLESVIKSGTIELVKIFSFEDTDHISDNNSNNAGTWEPYAGDWVMAPNGGPCIPNVCACDPDGCHGCDYHGLTPNGQIRSWYSQFFSCAPYDGAKKLRKYKIVGEPEVTGLTTAFTTEADLKTVLEALPQTWSFPYGIAGYVNWDYLATAPNDYNLYGHNAKYLISGYMLASEKELEYFVISYDGADGAGHTDTGAKCTTVSHILF